VGAVVVGIVLVVAGGIYFQSVNSGGEGAGGIDSAGPVNTQSQTIAEDSDQNNPSEGSTKKVTTDEVAKHNSEDDCWTIVGTNVYDITSYIPRHPGGEEILRACGTDGTSLFQQRTTADGQQIGSGSGHSSSAASQLEQFIIGSL